MEKSIDKNFAWAIFELFVKGLYKNCKRTKVLHKAVRYGKSGIRREIDVLVQVHTDLHKFYTLIECKCLNSKVSLAVVDRLTGVLEDFPGWKAAIFTTVGFTSNAYKVAKGRNIDIFIVREVNPSEWGSLGRIVEYSMSEFSCNISNIDLRLTRNMYEDESKEGDYKIRLPLKIGRNERMDRRYILYNNMGERTYNIAEILLHFRDSILKGFKGGFSGMNLSEYEKLQIAYAGGIVAPIGETEFRFLHLDNKLVEVKSLGFEFMVMMDKKKIKFDRATFARDFTLLLENPIARKKFWITKSTGSPEFKLTKFVRERPGNPECFIFPRNAKLSMDSNYEISKALKSSTKVQSIPNRYFWIGLNYDYPPRTGELSNRMLVDLLAFSELPR